MKSGEKPLLLRHPKISAAVGIGAFVGILTMSQHEAGLAWDSRHPAQVVRTDCERTTTDGTCDQYEVQFRQCVDDSYPLDRNNIDYPPVAIPEGFTCVDRTKTYGAEDAPGNLQPSDVLQPGDKQFPEF